MTAVDATLLLEIKVVQFWLCDGLMTCMKCMNCYNITEQGNHESITTVPDHFQTDLSRFVVCL